MAILVGLCVGVVVGSLGAQTGTGEARLGEELRAAIDQLGSLDYDVRMNAARLVRRADGSSAVPALERAVAEHSDSYVRFRALVLLTGYPNARLRDVMLSASTDPNDRLRAVAYGHFEHSPDPTLTSSLLQALDREDSEFVRPALIRALAALGNQDPRVRPTLLADVGRGVDFFRSVVIEALGDHRAEYAVDALIRVAELEGPLQDDAIIALGKIGDDRTLETFARLQRTAPRATQPDIAAAICLVGVNCDRHRGYLEDTLRFGVANVGSQELTRAAAGGLAALAVAGDLQALGALFDIGIPTLDPARAPIALAVGTVAIKSPEMILSVLSERLELDNALLLLRDAFDMLDEDLEEERFYVVARDAFWQASEGSSTKRAAEALVRELEF